jgi:L-threonylcarbamoyladenylate synthase
MANVHWQIARASRTIWNRGVIAYPTESVYGLGCDPLDEYAVARILAMKQRPISKGLILIAANINQLSDYISFSSLPSTVTDYLAASWPGPITCVLPATHAAPKWVTGNHNTIAVRVTSHPVAKALCEHVGSAIISTSANVATKAPALCALDVRCQNLPDIDFILAGDVGSLGKPTTIVDPFTMQQLRN